MSQPREHPVPCRACHRKTWNVTAICDGCSSFGDCDLCGEDAPRQTVSDDGDLLLFCAPCAESVGQAA